MTRSIPDAAVHKHFKYTVLASKKKRYAECIRCHKWTYAQNTTRQREHLQKCPRYSQWKEANNVFAAREAQLNLNRFRTLIDPICKARINKKIAYAIYVTGKPFTLFNDPAWLLVF
jgi:hypothetical protein